MRKILVVITFVMMAFFVKGQTFNGTGGNIPGTSTTPTCFPITVTGVGNINAVSKGLASVCIKITHPYTDELEVLLKAPDGTTVPLTVQNGGSGADYNNTCFSNSATTSIKFGTAPFSGTFIPEGYLGSLNNGQNANGTWDLCIQDRRNAGNQGVLNSWSLTFSNTPATSPPSFPVCSNTLPPTSSCATATSVCDFNGLCGSTAGSSVQDWPGSGLGGCFGLQNNSFIKFIASANTAAFTVWVPTSSSGPSGGIQMLFFSGNCNSGAVSVHGCYPHIFPYQSAANPLPTIITAAGLTVGNTYYLMFDGFNNDNCTFSIAATTGVNILDITPSAPAICAGKNVNLTASGGNGVYTWNPAAGLSATTGTTVNAAPSITSTYTVNSTTASGCSLTKDVTVTVNARPVINNPATPDTQRVCQNGTVTPLQVTAVPGSGTITGYQWYLTTTPPYNPPGTALPFATSATFLPSSSSIGQLHFFSKVTNSNGCSDTSDLLAVLIVSSPVATPTASATIQPTCAVPTGTIVVTAPASPNIQYSKDGVTYQVSATFSNLGSGNYNITAKNTVTGCVSGVRVVTINAAPAGPAIPAGSVTTQPNCSVPAGTITVTSPIGTYEYSIGGAFQASTTFPGLTNSTTYNLTVKDISTGCISNALALTVNAIPGAPAAPSVDPPAQPDCNTPTGSITINSPTGNYEYSNGGTYQAGNSFTGLLPGTNYSITARDISTGCVSAPTNVAINNISPVAAPAVTSPVTFCQNATTTVLTAAGSNLLWYTVASGGTGSATAPTPSSATAASTDYYVSQTAGVCESPRALITVTIVTQPAAPAVTGTVAYCQNGAAIQLSATGNGLLWYTAASGGSGSSTAPTPATTTAAATNYYVSQTVNGCESNRSLITVTINPTPAAPTVTNAVTYCQNELATALTATGTNLFWYTALTGGVGSSAAPIPVTTVAANTDYYVSQTISGCEGPRALITVTVNPTPAAPTVTTPVGYCQNIVSQALVATGSNLLWYTTLSGGTGDPQPIVPSTTSVGSFDYYVSQTVNGCESQRAVITVNIGVAPAAPAVTSPVTYCQSAVAMPLTATGNNLLWYSTATGGTGSSANPTPSTTAAGNTIYYVSQTTNGCESGTRAAITVTVNSYPGAPVVNNTVAYCQGATAAALTATGSGLLWYTTATGGSGSSTAPTVSTATAATTNYYVSQTLNGCEGTRAVIAVTINAIPATPFVNSPVIYCQNAAATALTATGTNLLWYTGLSGGSGSATAPTPSTITGGNTTGYYVSQTITGCESPRSQITVTVNALPAPPTVISPVTYCQNTAAVALTATGANLLWYTTASGGTNLSTAPTPSTSTPGNTFYYVTQTINGCESQRRAITVTVDVSSTAVAGFHYTPDTICLNGMNPVPAYDLGFTNGGTFASAPAGLDINAATGNINLASSTVGTYNVTYTYNSTGCITGSNSGFNITLIPSVSTVTVFSYSSPVCKNAPNLSPQTANGFTTGGIFSAPGGLAVDGSTGAINVANSTPGLYQVAYRLAALGCRQGTTNFSFVTVTDTTSPVTNFNYNSIDVCISTGINPAIIKPSDFSAGGTFSATPAGLKIDAVTGDINIGLSVPGVYKIVYAIPPLACQLAGRDSITFLLRAYGNPVTNFSYFSPVCKGDDTATAVTDLAFTAGGIFSSTPTGLSINAATGVIDLRQSLPNNYTIRYDVTAGVCNPAGFGTTGINILGQPEAPTLAPAAICGPGNISLTADALGTVSWYTEPALLNQVNVGNSFNTFISNTTPFYVTNTIGTCESEPAVLTAVVNPVPVKPFLGGDTSICTNDKLILNPGIYNNYLWQDGSINRTYTVPGSGIYKVTVSTGVGCEDSASISVTILDNCDDILFPTAFSPGGTNKTFGALGNLFIVSNYSLRIFNRYGEVIFATSDPHYRWDGNYKGKPVNIGTYVYVATYIYKNRITKTQKGTITVIR